ncbi:FUSC family protein [Demequina soli]|uniref:FUSC family protein n=1 Tax=Demequina soli TaxID=1638987 RepID=UPI000785EA14|nr:FUSC family protein [Demequina soli]
MTDDAHAPRTVGRAWAGGARRAFVSLGQVRPVEGPRWPLALQAALSMALPVAIGVASGHASVGLIASSGAFACLYASDRRPLDRVRILPIVATVLTLCTALGSLTGPWPLLSAAGLVAVAVGAAAITHAFSVGPPGPLFPVLAYGLASHLSVLEGGARHTPPGTLIAAYAAGSALACAIAAASLARPLNRRGPASSWRRLLRGPRWDPVSTELLVRALIVAIVGTGVSLAVVDPARAYWTVSAGLAVIGSRPGRRHAAQRGLHRIVGTVAGALLYVAVAAAFSPPPLALAAILGALQFGAQMLVVRHYALALVCITPNVLILSGAARGVDPTMTVVTERVMDTVVGAVLGAATGLLHRPAPRPPG